MQRHRLLKQISLPLRRMVIVALFASSFMGAATALTQAPDDTLDWWTVDGGGGRWASADGQYVLQGTVGQPDAQVWGHGAYTLVGGFWHGGAPTGHKLYLPLITRDFDG